MNRVRPLPLLLKAFVLFALSNLVFAGCQPSVGRISLYNGLIPGRLRVPYEREAEYYPLAHTLPVYEDMDAMFASHVISRPKAEDEYRVVLVGDSSAWGFELRPEETLTGRLDAMDLRTCDGRRIRFYNAAFPAPYVVKDLLILDRVRTYAPDLFLWTLTLDGFLNRTAYTSYFLDPHAARVAELAEQHGLTKLDTSKMNGPTFWDATLIGQRSRLKKILLLQVHGLGWSATGLDYDYREYPPLPNDVTDSDLYFEIPPGRLAPEDLLFDVLDAGVQLAGDVPVLFVNEPIQIVSGANRDIRYNEIHPRWAYDAYRKHLDQLMTQEGYHYIDAWDWLPPSEFTSAPYHRSPAGEVILAGRLAPLIERLSCEP